MIFRRLTAPQGEPISLPDARRHLRITDDSLDPLILRLISTARGEAEKITHRALLAQDWLAALDAFPTCDGGRIRLPAPPVAAVVSATYVDTSGVTQTMAPEAYLLDNISEPCWLFPAYEIPWPSTRDVPNAVRIRVSCGYELAEVPEEVTQWMLLHVAHWFENPQACVIGTTVNTLPYAAELLQHHTVLTID